MFESIHAFIAANERFTASFLIFSHVSSFRIPSKNSWPSHVMISGIYSIYVEPMLEMPSGKMEVINENYVFNLTTSGVF